MILGTMLITIEIMNGDFGGNGNGIYTFTCTYGI